MTLIKLRGTSVSIVLTKTNDTKKKTKNKWSLG